MNGLAFPVRSKMVYDHGKIDDSLAQDLIPIKADAAVKFILTAVDLA